MMNLSELKQRMKGVMVVQATPFNIDGSLDLEGIRSNTRRLAEYAEGRDFIFTPVGSVGEFFSMSKEECQSVIKAVVEETKGRALVMPGAGRAGTDETIKMCQYAQSVGADGALVVEPYYMIPEEEGMYLHYKKIAENVDKNFAIIVYNNPGVSGSWIKPNLMKRLSQISNIIGVKETTYDISNYHIMINTVDPKDTVILGGKGERTFSFQFLYGCPGFVSLVADFAPELSYLIYETAIKKDFSKLTEIINFRIKPYDDFVRKVTESYGPNTGIPGLGGSCMVIPVFKAAMEIMGLKAGPPRLPMIPLRKKEKDELRDILKNIKLL